jgi:phosphoribosylformimino-5-aminoimidazole carboxamide ribotide isomerase
MIIFPAIDLLDGKCVRLFKGDYNLSEQVALDPIDTAKSFLEAGAKHLHVVDLNAAKSGTRVNFNVIKKLTGLGLSVQTGGGIRDIETIKASLDAGVSRVIIGSKAVSDRAFLLEAVSRFKDKIIVGADAKDGLIRTDGWLKNSGIHYVDFVKDLEKVGVKTVVFTDISKDGTLEGVSLESLKTLKACVKLNLIASGGVKDINDIKSLKELGVYGAICGKSLYAGTLSLADALAAANVK